MGSAFNIGKLFGIQFRLHYTWFIIFLLVTFSLSWRYFPAFYPEWSYWIYWVTGIVTSLLFFASVLAHELSHSLVAKKYGIPVKSITLFIFGGVARITKEATKAGVELKMAAAGPACSLAIGALCALLWFFSRDISEPVAGVTLWLAQINVLLAVFNLIPGFPLDGGRVFRSILWRFTGNYKTSTRIAVYAGRGVGYLLILGGISMMVFLREWFGGLWLAFIGWFLENAASSSYRQVMWREALQGFTASQLMTSDYLVVPSSITVSQLIRNYILTTGRHLFIVADDGRLAGVLTLSDVKSVPQQNWDATRVNEIMTTVGKLKVAYPEQDVLSVMEQMDEDTINQIPVVSGNTVIGVVTRDNLINFFRTRSELKI